MSNGHHVNVCNTQLTVNCFILQLFSSLLMRIGVLRGFIFTLLAPPPKPKTPKPSAHQNPLCLAGQRAAVARTAMPEGTWGHRRRLRRDSR